MASSLISDDQCWPSGEVNGRTRSRPLGIKVSGVGTKGWVEAEIVGFGPADQGRYGLTRGGILPIGREIDLVVAVREVPAERSTALAVGGRRRIGNERATVSVGCEFQRSIEINER